MEIKEENKVEILKLIPKMENYIRVMIGIISHIPRTERYNIGNEYKIFMYKNLEYAFLINRVSIEERFKYLNLIDTNLDIQRSLLRIMYDSNWIEKKKTMYIMTLISEIGKIVGGLIKYYGEKRVKK